MRTLEQGRAYQAKYQKLHPATIRAKNQKYAHDHPDFHKEADRRYRQNYREFVRQLKVGKVCVICAESDTPKLDFHHIDPATKLFDIGGRPHSRKAVLEEVLKCEVRCKHCHGNFHGNRQLA